MVRHLLTSAFVVLVVGVAGFVPAYAASRPNILVVLVDDMGYSDLGCYGGEIRTPHLDHLAANGIRYTQMYNTAKCYPTRACLNTGIYFQRTNRDFTGTATVGEVLRPAGYRTLWVGKHHATFDPRTRGFDGFEGFLGGAGNFWNPGAEARPGEGEPPRKGTNAWIVDGELKKTYVPPKGFYTTDAFTDQAIEWLRESKASPARPFYLYVAYNAPHWPLHAWPEDIRKYDGVYNGGYRAIREARYERQLAMGLFEKDTAPLPNEGLAAMWEAYSPLERQQWADRMEIHAAMVDRVDQNVGRLVAVLRELELLDNTVIVFLADNGASAEYVNRRILHGDYDGAWGGVNSFECISKGWAHAANTPMRLYKATSHEGGINTPMIVHWPRGITRPGTIDRTACHVMDLLPTWIELAGASYPGQSKQQGIPPLDGVSLKPTFTGRAVTRDKPLFFQFGQGRAVHDGKWKLVRRGKTPWELYDLSQDRTETRDLASTHPQRVQRMIAAWERWYQACTGRAFPADTPTRKKTRTPM